MFASLINSKLDPSSSIACLLIKVEAWYRWPRGLEHDLFYDCCGATKKIKVRFATSTIHTVHYYIHYIWIKTKNWREQKKAWLCERYSQSDKAVQRHGCSLTAEPNWGLEQKVLPDIISHTVYTLAHSEPPVLLLWEMMISVWFWLGNATKNGNLPCPSYLRMELIMLVEENLLNDCQQVTFSHLWLLL